MPASVVASDMASPVCMFASSSHHWVSSGSCVILGQASNLGGVLIVMLSLGPLRFCVIFQPWVG